MDIRLLAPGEGDPTDSVAGSDTQSHAMYDALRWSACSPSLFFASDEASAGKCVAVDPPTKQELKEVQEEQDDVVKPFEVSVPVSCRHRETAVDLPPDVMKIITAFLPPHALLRSFGLASKFYSFDWLVKQFPRVITVPDETPSINRAMNLLTCEDLGGNATGTKLGLLLVRPGVYRETVRVTRNCILLGLGRREDIIIEAPGWESALVFSGVGQQQAHDVMDMTLGSGESARIVNLSFRCRNEQMRGRTVYIVLGSPVLERCNVYGTVQINGTRTAPLIMDCNVRESRGSGLHFTDHCLGVLRTSKVTRNGCHGVFVDRGANPAIEQNFIGRNRHCGIRVCRNESSDQWISRTGVLGNTFEQNGQDPVSCGPLCDDSDEDFLESEALE